MASLNALYKSVLVTGAAGAVGSQVLGILKDKYPDVRWVVLDLLSYAGKLENIRGPRDSFVFYYGDVCDEKLVSHILETERIDSVIHLAAESSVDVSFSKSFDFTRSNVLGVHVMLECVRKHVVAHPGLFKVFLHVSSDEVYGSVDDDQPPRKEEPSLFYPSNPYSCSKSCQELYCQAYAKSFKLPIIIIRMNNIISPTQHEEKLVPQVVRRLMAGEKIRVHGDGSAKRTFIHTNDVAAAFETVLTKGTIGKIYNIGTENEYSVLDVIRTVCEIMRPGEDAKDHITFVEDRAFQDYRYSIDTTALRALGWTPKMAFQESVEDVVRHVARRGA